MAPQSTSQAIHLEKLDLSQIEHGDTVTITIAEWRRHGARKRPTDRLEHKDAVFHAHVTQSAPWGTVRTKTWLELNLQDSHSDIVYDFRSDARRYYPGQSTLGWIFNPDFSPAAPSNWVKGNVAFRIRLQDAPSVIVGQPLKVVPIINRRTYGAQVVRTVSKISGIVVTKHPRHA